MTDTSPATAPDGRAVANRLLDLAEERGMQLTLMQLLKILFFAHGISLGVRGVPLVADRAQAWQYGPVFPRVYRAFSKWGRLPIRDRAINKATGRPFAAELSAEELAVLSGTLDTFGPMEAFKLSDLSHAPGSPWDVTYRKEGVYKEIPNELIRDFYADIAKRAGAGSAAA